MKDGNAKYDVRVDWPTVVPLGDTLAVSTGSGFDDRWVKAFEVVVDEYQRRVTDRAWSKIDFEYAADRTSFVVYVRKVQPAAKSRDLRRILDDVAKVTNSVAQVGTHVYELARELREPEPATAQAASPRGSTPPPPTEELRADAA